jgi:hypothetical protein
VDYVGKNGSEEPHMTEKYIIQEEHSSLTRGDKKTFLIYLSKCIGFLIGEEKGVFTKMIQGWIQSILSILIVTVVIKLGVVEIATVIHVGTAHFIH